jgi:hypothetical protein
MLHGSSDSRLGLVRARLNRIQDSGLTDLPEKTPETRVASFYRFHGVGHFPGITVQFHAKKEMAFVFNIA